MSSFWIQLRERKFAEWIIAYLAGAWLLLQVADFLRENFDWSPIFVRVLTVVLAFGFLAVLVIAWYHGARGAQRARRGELAALLAIAATAAGAAWYVAGLEAEAAADGRAADEETPPALLTAFDPATAAGSIAVLPFVNMTPDENNDYLSDGITEDITAELGKSSGLRVISRTSVMGYKGTTKTIRQIGAELGVSTILEGSIRVQDDKVRIVAQLIDVGTDAHLWTGTYDRDLKDIFAVQTEVAQDITTALNATLAPVVVAAEERTDAADPEAYRLYSKGKALAGSKSPEDRQKAVAYLDSAVQKDPEFAEAYAALATLQAPISLDAMAPPSRPAASGMNVTAAAERALELNPRLADARSAWAMQRAIEQGDLDGAEKAVREAVTTNPNSVPSRMRFVQILAGRGQMEEAQRELQTVVKLDPLSPQVNAKAGEIALAMGKPGEAEVFLRRAIDLDSTSAFPHITLAMLEKERGNMEAAIAEAQKAANLAPGDPAALSALGYIFGAAGRTADALRIVEQLEAEVEAGHAPHSAIAQIHIALGDMSQAVEWLKLGADLPRERMVAIMNPRIRQSLERLRADPALGAAVDSLLQRAQSRVHVPPPDTTHRTRPGRQGSSGR